MPFTVHVITGGIAVGKTTAVNMLKSEVNFHVFDSDEITHHLQQPGNPGYVALKKRFPSVFDATAGKLDRQKLADIVFEQSEKGERERRALNSIMQPLIMKYIFTGIFNLWLQNFFSMSNRKPAIVIVDAPVFLEMEEKMSRLLLRAPFNSVVVVSTKEEMQLQRLQARGDGCSESEAKKRIAAQMPLSKKEKLADHVLRNDGNLSDLKKEVEKCVEKLRFENANSRSSWNTLMFVASSVFALVCVGGLYLVKVGVEKLLY